MLAKLIERSAKRVNVLFGKPFAFGWVFVLLILFGYTGGGMLDYITNCFNHDMWFVTDMFLGYIFWELVFILWLIILLFL